MTIFAIDDEPKALRLLHDAIAEAEPNAEIVDYSDGEAALTAIRSQALTPDVVFSDIELPELSGLAFAVELKKLAPETRIIFVTGFPKYAADAFRLHASGYIVKPVYADRVREELDLLNLPQASPNADKLHVHCFGHFEVFRNGEPVIFQRKQSKELLAFLIDREGSACTAEENGIYSKPCPPAIYRPNTVRAPASKPAYWESIRKPVSCWNTGTEACTPTASRR